MKKSFAFILVLFIASTLSAQDEPLRERELTFRDFPWGTSKEEFIAKEGEPFERIKDISLEDLIYDNVIVSSYECVMVVRFLNNELIQGKYCLKLSSPESAKNCYDDLSEKLIFVYDTPDYAEDNYFHSSFWNFTGGDISLSFIEDFDFIGISYQDPYFYDYDDYSRLKLEKIRFRGFDFGITKEEFIAKEGEPENIYESEEYDRLEYKTKLASFNTSLAVYFYNNKLEYASYSSSYYKSFSTYSEYQMTREKENLEKIYARFIMLLNIIYEENTHYYVRDPQRLVWNLENGTIELDINIYSTSGAVYLEYRSTFYNERIITDTLGL